MSDTYVECLVKCKQSMMGKLGRILLVMLTVAFGLLTLMGIWPAFFIALAAGIGAYFVWMHTELEYEYLYLDKEMTVDKVMAQTKRKRVATYEVERMEIFAPIKSYHLDNFKNRQCKTVDYSTREEEQPDTRYVMYYEGNVRVILSPSPELVKVLRSAAPRKVFQD